MMPFKVLPVRPSLESVQKEAEELCRAIEAGEGDAVRRARESWPDKSLPLSRGDAEVVLAREYGFVGWQQLRKEVLRRTGHGLPWALEEGRRAIRDRNLERLKQLVEENPGLLSYQDEEGKSLLGAATESFSDSFNPSCEQTYTRSESVEFLLDQGAAVYPRIWEDMISARTRGLMNRFWERGLLPRTLPILAAVGDVGAIRTRLAQHQDDTATVAKAFMNAARFKSLEAATLLLDRYLDLAPEVAWRVEHGPGRAAFAAYFGEHHLEYVDPWRTYVLRELLQAISDNDLPSFTQKLQDEPALLGPSDLGAQVQILERATLRDRAPFIEQLLKLDPAVLHTLPRPPSAAMEYAMEYGHTHLTALLARVWPVPHDLPHAAGLGDFAAVKHWFDAAGQPVLGELENHFPVNNPRKRGHLHWGEGNAQQVLDVALAWACVNHHFDIAAFLLEHGANVSTNWSTHEPASILHECAIRKDREGVQFLIDHGVDLTMRDWRWNGTAQAWAYSAAKDEELSDLLGKAQEQRESRPGP
jgi:hypothetical protein